MKGKIGTVTKTFGLFYTVKYNNEYINCILRGKIRQNKELKTFSNPIAVGDKVTFTLNQDGSGAIDSIVKRINFFSRKEKGRNEKEDIIASNIDLVTIIQSFKRPKLNLRFVDRLIVRSNKEKIPVLLCINKLDIAGKKIIEYIKKYYFNGKINICFTSAITGEGIQKLKQYLSNKTSLFVGNSGVGKTSILNFIYPGLNLRTSEVSQRTNKGRHTTANIEMIDLSNNITIIDTPGIREFGLMNIEPHMLGTYFYEFNQYIGKCLFNPCSHDHEPDCEVKKQVINGGIFEDRYLSYLNILYSLKENYGKKYK